MATVKPFRAIRPSGEKVARVISRSYLDYSKKELATELGVNPYSFLHILSPEINPGEKPGRSEHAEAVRRKFLKFMEEGIFARDPRPGIYIYRITGEDIHSYGFFCAASITDYRAGIIKKHEETFHRREKLFAEYLDIVRINAEAVLLTYPDHPGISGILTSEMRKAPEYTVTTSDRYTHSMWPVFDPDVISRLQGAVEDTEALYIADGHHRSASSAMLAERMQSRNGHHGGDETYNYFMSFLVPESEIRIHEFNRLVRGLNGLSDRAFLLRLKASFKVRSTGARMLMPKEKHHFCMYLDHVFYSLELKQKRFDPADPLCCLDTRILYETVLEPILGIRDPRNDHRIAYWYGKQNLFRMKEAIDRGTFSVGFGLAPVSMEELKSVADSGLVMPPKSTYIEPKLRSGLILYEL